MHRPSESPQAPTEERLAFETLIADTSARLMAGAPADLDAIVEAAFEDIRLFFQADRCGLMEVSADLQVVHPSHGAYGEGVQQVPKALNVRGWFPWAASEVLEHRRPVVIPRISALPPEATVDRATFEALGTKAQMTVPLVGEAGLTHLVVLASVSREREWPEALIPRLRVIGEMMVGALQRARAFESIRAREAELQLHAARLQASVEAAGIGFWEWVVDEGPPFADAQLSELLGLQPGDEANLADLWLSRIEPDQVPLIREQGRQILAGEIDRAQAEYRYHHPTRGWIWLRRSARRLTDRAPRVHLIATVQDTTEARVREAALASALAEVRQLRDRLEEENVYLRKERKEGGGDPESALVAGRSPAIRRVVDMAEQVAATNSTVLLLGETGTGKERFAEMIHASSSRRHRHMVRVNCSAIPGALIESELFGREKGAYTGALSKQIGRFELAQGATLFLDEIGDLPMDVQVKLLRVLEERTIERLGSPTPIPVDVRIIAATNRDLEAAVRAGTFRADLYFRLNVFPIQLPPLRDRREDIPALVEVFVTELSSAIRKRFDAIDKASLQALTRYEWPGNVRELRNVLERAMILETSRTLRVTPPNVSPVVIPEASPPSHERSEIPEQPAASPGPPSGPRSLRDLERSHIAGVLQDTGWRIRGPRGAAAILGVKPTTLEARMKRLGIHRPGSSV